MRLYGYGRDVLTLCALSRNLDEILVALDDNSLQSDCQTFYRPRFGRRGVRRGPDLGEFEFILLSHHSLYLGESRWDRSPGEIEEGILQMQPDETVRHELFRFYVEQWAYGDYGDWEAFRTQAQPLVEKPLAKSGTRLASNLQTVLGVVKEHFPQPPASRDVLLYFHHACSEDQPPSGVGGGFELVCVDCSAAVKDNFVTIAV
jgi:hypothetical protein